MADLSTSGGQAPGLGIARPAGAGTFVRQATGLVRQASTLDTFIYNTHNQNIGIGVLVSVAAILFPYRLPDVFEGSPVNWRFAGLPVITLVGVVSLISMIIVEVLYWIDPVIGVALSPLFQRVTVGVIVSGALVYLGIKWLQASRGVRVERAFQEIPPE
jgi:hypothetical protein